MKKLTIWVALLLMLCLTMIVIAGCGPSKPETKATEAPKVEAPATETPKAEAPKTEDAGGSTPLSKEKNRVALILEGAISDMSWNATAYAGLQKIEALGAEIKYVENVGAAAVSDAIRNFADAGYNVIFLSTNSYQDNGAATAKEYPEVMFFMINSKVTAPNVRSFAIQDAEQGYLMGALSALMTQKKSVGFIGGLPINPIINGGKGFEQGVKYVDPEIKINSQNTGNFDDVNAAKELAKAMVGQGADVLSPMANQASLGVMEAAEEAGVKAIGSGLNQETVAPNACIVAIVKDTSIAYEAAYKAFLKGEMPEEILPMGAAQGVVYIGDYYLEIPQDVKDKLTEVYQKLASGEIKIDLK